MGVKDDWKDPKTLTNKELIAQAQRRTDHLKDYTMWDIEFTVFVDAGVTSFVMCVFVCFCFVFVL